MAYEPSFWKKFSRVALIAALFLFVLPGVFKDAAISPAFAQTFSMPVGVQEGDVVRGPDGISVYIVNQHGYKRHIYNPAVFNMYGHLRWENIKSVNQATLDLFITSDLYRADGDYKVYLTDGIDEAKGIATKRWLDITAEEFFARGYRPEQVFVINPVERDYYTTGKSVGEIAALIDEAVARMNELRAIAGLNPVTLDENLSRGAALHVRYLFLNREYLFSTPGVSFHDEEVGRPGYTDEGRGSGISSNIATRNIFSPPVWAVNAFVDTFYHRIGMLRPGLKTVGIGFADHPDLEYEFIASVSVIDIINGLEVSPNDPPVVYPAPGQRYVPTDFVDESPDPLPADALRPAGYPVTVQFSLYTRSVTDEHATLVDSSGTSVPFYLWTPSNPPLADISDNFLSIAVTPVSPLRHGETYTVSISAMVDGVSYGKTWSFTTAP